MCTLCDSTNINTKIEFVPNCLYHVSGSSFAAILVNSAPSGEMHNYCTPHIIKEKSENFLIHRCNYILLSQVYCVWRVVKTPTIILNNPVYMYRLWVTFPPNTVQVAWWKLSLRHEPNVFKRLIIRKRNEPGSSRTKPPFAYAFTSEHLKAKFKVKAKVSLSKEWRRIER